MIPISIEINAIGIPTARPNFNRPLSCARPEILLKLLCKGSVVCVERTKSLVTSGFAEIFDTRAVGIDNRVLGRCSMRVAFSYFEVLVMVLVNTDAVERLFGVVDIVGINEAGKLLTVNVEVSVIKIVKFSSVESCLSIILTNILHKWDFLYLKDF